jgi:ferrous iron transport protein A
LRTTINSLKKGETAIIKEFDIEAIPLKLLEMGCLPGSEIEMTHLAPFGDPLAIKVSGYTLTMRKDEAATIQINLLNN